MKNLIIVYLISGENIDHFASNVKKPPEIYSYFDATFLKNHTFLPILPDEPKGTIPVSAIHLMTVYERYEDVQWSRAG